MCPGGIGVVGRKRSTVRFRDETRGVTCLTSSRNQQKFDTNYMIIMDFMGCNYVILADVRLTVVT